MNKKQKNTAVPKTKFQKILTWRWYIKALVILVIIFTGFQVFKFGMNTYNISLLDKAEVKMLALDVPKADYSEYRRSCSFRSVKFGGAGSPNCSLERIEVYFNQTNESAARIGNSYLANITSKYPSVKAGFGGEEDLTKIFTKTSDRKVDIENISYQEGLKCYTNLILRDGLGVNVYLGKAAVQEDSVNLLTINSCYRRFMFQTYPEL